MRVQRLRSCCLLSTCRPSTAEGKKGLSPNSTFNFDVEDSCSVITGKSPTKGLHTSSEMISSSETDTGLKRYVTLSMDDSLLVSSLLLRYNMHNVSNKCFPLSHQPNLTRNKTQRFNTVNHKFSTDAGKMLSSVISSVNGSAPKKLTLKQCYLLLAHLAVIFIVFQGAQRFRRRTGAVYPVLTSSREHFLSAVRPYTALREVDRELAGTEYLQSPQLRDSDIDALRVIVEDYIQFHKRNRHNASRILIFRPRRTGLGDRLTVLAFAFWAASISGRLFLVDWQYPFPLSQLFQNANPDVDMFFSKQLDDPDNETTSDNPSSKVAFLRAKEKEVKEYEAILFSKVSTVIMEMHYIPELSEAFVAKKFPPGVRLAYVRGVASTIPFFRIVFHHIFKLSDQVLQYQRQVSRRMRIRPTYPIHFQNSEDQNTQDAYEFVEEFDESARPYIAVHARVGTGVGEVQQKGRFTDIGRDMKTGAMCLASRAVRLAHMSGNPPLPIYLATDTPSFRDVFRDVVERFSHGRVEVVVGDWDVVHINAFTLPNNTRGAQTPKQQKALRDIYVDFVMLGHAEHMVALYSSFPRLAQGVGTARTLTELRNEVCFKIDKWK